MKNPVLLFILLTAAIFSSCSDDPEIPSTQEPVAYTVSGKAEKGPFIHGSTIHIQPLDEHLSPLGTLYSSTIKNDEGDFDFPAQKFTSPYALLSTTDSYFFNEVTGKLSKGTLRLEAIVDLSDKTTVNLNLLTHLKVNRIKKLFSTGLSFKEANAQAQKELLTNFGLQQYTNTDASEFSITAGTKEAGALIVISSALLYERTEAELTEHLSKLNQEFSAQGKLTDEMKQGYLNNCIQLDLENISRHIVEHYRSVKKEITIQPLQYFIDWDGDGIAGNELGDGSEMQLAFEKDTLFVPAAGGTFRAKVNTNIPFAFTYKGMIPGPIVSPDFNLRPFNISDIEYTEAVEAQNIVLTISPARTYHINPTPVTIYSLDGTRKAILTIVQEGDKTKPALADDGIIVMDGILSSTASTLYHFRIMEALYTNTHASVSGAGDFETHQLTSENTEIYTAWSTVYKTLRQIRVLSNAASRTTNEFTAYFTSLTAMLYYEMAVIWENVPYAERTTDGFIAPSSVVQMNSQALFDLFENQLASQIDRCEDKKNTFDSSEDYFRCSKDYPRMLLAKMYLYQKEYTKAKPLLEAIVSGGHYQIAPSREQALQKNSPEMIWGYTSPLVTDPSSVTYQPVQLDDFLPFATYTEVLLSLAECEFRLGNAPAATNYLQKVTSKRGLTATGEFLTSLKTVWKSELKGTGTYFAFLKRNDLAKQELNIEGFRLLFPIPLQELAMEPNLMQNPGYN